MSTTVFIFVLVGSILAVNALIWLFIISAVRRRATSQLERYGPIDPGLANGSVISEAKSAHYLGTTVDGGRYYAPGYWARGNGSASLTEEALIFKRIGIASPIVVPRAQVLSIERRKKFAGRHLFKPIVTVVCWEMKGGNFESGFVLGKDEETRAKWEAQISKR
jgi:hypothetical protein